MRCRRLFFKLLLGSLVGSALFLALKSGSRAESVHRKLILQLEEVMEAQLAEAEASVAAIQKARPLSLSLSLKRLP